MRAARPRPATTSRCCPARSSSSATRTRRRRRRSAQLDSLVHPDSGVAEPVDRGSASTRRASTWTAPLPEIPQTNASQSGRAALVAPGAARQPDGAPAGADASAAMAACRWSARRREIADTMQEWLETEACDGFNVMFPDRAGRAGRLRGPGRARAAARAACSGANTRARRCARTSGCRGRRTGSFRPCDRKQKRRGADARLQCHLELCRKARCISTTLVLVVTDTGEGPSRHGNVCCSATLMVRACVFLNPSLRPAEW